MSPGVGVDACVWLNVGAREPVALRLDQDGGAHLDIGDTVEVMLTETHVVALREQSAGVLADMRVVRTVEDRVVEAGVVGELAASTVTYARAQAAAAMAVGATQEARAARAAAERASDSAGVVHNAVEAVLEAIQRAEEAIEATGDAAAVAARAAAAAAGDADHRERARGDQAVR